MLPIVRHKKSSIPYQYIGGKAFKNLITGATGEVEDEKARNIFVVNLELTQMVHEFPIVGEMIKRLKLKIDK